MIKYVPEFGSRPCMAARHTGHCLHRRHAWVGLIKLQAPITPENVLSLKSLVPGFVKIYAVNLADVTISIDRSSP